MGITRPPRGEARSHSLTCAARYDSKEDDALCSPVVWSVHVVSDKCTEVRIELKERLDWSSGPLVAHEVQVKRRAGGPRFALRGGVARLL